MTGFLSKSATDAIINAAVSAGILIRNMRQGGAEARHKADGSPVTDADVAAEELILACLARVAAEVPVVAEETFNANAKVVAGGAAFFLVDPLDGTKEYVNGRSDYTVNVALVVDRVPIFGVVVAPELNKAYVGLDGVAMVLEFTSDGHVGSQRTIAARAPGNGLTAVVSGSHLDSGTKAYLARVAVKDRMSVGSSLKFCQLAAGEADVYPRLGRTMQWDTAAGDAVLRNAGGMTYRISGDVLAYGPCAGAPDDSHPFANPSFISFGAWPAEQRITHTTACLSVLS